MISETEIKQWSTDAQKYVHKFNEWAAKLPSGVMDQTVSVVSDDGSIFMFHNALSWAIWAEGVPAHEPALYMGVVTEHHGDHFFCVDDLVSWEVIDDSWTKDYKASKEKFKEFCSTRALKDYGEVVQVSHQDGTIFVFHNAAHWTPGDDDPNFIGVSTEHCGDHFFVTDDIEWRVI